MGINEALLFLLAGVVGFGIGWAMFSKKLMREREKSVRLSAREEALEQRLEEQQASLDKMQEQLRLEFRTTAQRLFEETSNKLSTQSEKKLGDVLQPLRERLGEFQKLVGESFATQGKEQHTLKAEIERIVKMNEQMRSTTDNLTKALRGDVKAQGNWGEVILERILEESGLRAGSDYILQGTDLGLTGSEGNRLRPDVIINLPDKKHIILDSKVSLTAYERYCAGDGQQELHLRDFIKSLRAHVNGLEQKRYQDLPQLGTPDFVLMFMPIEGAFSLAMQHDQELHAFAWGKQIAIVCPSTLFATLKTIASLWKIEKQNRNTQEIATQGGKLYDQFAAFVEDMTSIGTQLERTSKVYDSAMKRLHTGRGNLIGQVEKLKALGVKTSKSLPQTDAEEDVALALVSANE